MKKINKLQEPESLVFHRTQQYSSFDNIPLDTKNEIRTSLLLEQGHICCYCMKRIPVKLEQNERNNYEMKIEHFLCQDDYPQHQLAYSNMLGACTGNEGSPRKLQTCDTKKGNSFLKKINPIKNAPCCEKLLKYNAEGEVSSIEDVEDTENEINCILNLNMQSLKDGRREVYLEVQKRIEAESKKIKGRDLKIKYFKEELSKWLTPQNNKYRPFCMVAVYYLSKKIRQYALTK